MQWGSGEVRFLESPLASLTFVRFKNPKKGTLIIRTGTLIILWLPGYQDLGFGV